MPLEKVPGIVVGPYEVNTPSDFNGLSPEAKEQVFAAIATGLLGEQTAPEGMDSLQFRTSKGSPWITVYRTREGGLSAAYADRH